MLLKSLSTLLCSRKPGEAQKENNVKLDITPNLTRQLIIKKNITGECFANQTRRMPRFLGCFVKCFYLVWCKIIGITLTVQECIGEGASKAVPTWCAVSIARVSRGTATGWRVVANVNVVASTESRSIRRTVVNGISVRTILPCLRQFHRCPSWLVNKRENKCLRIISIPLATAITCWEIKKWKGLSTHTLCLKIWIHTDKKISDTTSNN